MVRAADMQSVWRHAADLDVESIRERELHIPTAAGRRTSRIEADHPAHVRDVLELAAFWADLFGR